MIDLNDFDLVIINSSAGKDSLCAIWEICRLADEQSYPRSRIHVSHQDLGQMEWPGTRDLAAAQASHFGLAFRVSKRRDKNGVEGDLLEYVERRGKWPSNKQRFCTSDFKRGPGSRVVTALSRQYDVRKVLHVFGFRAEESPSRSKKDVLKLNIPLTTRSREVWDFLPIHNWSLGRVWETIKANGLPYHPAYDLGMPRLSCCFCIFSPFDALVIAGKANPELLQRYVDVEDRIGHTFKNGCSIKSVKDAIASGYEPDKPADWVM